MEDRTFVAEHGHCFFLGDLSTTGWPRLRRLFSARTIYATIVRQIRWAGDPYPGSTISRNVLTIPKFGRVYFGEVLIDPDQRRLTMVRSTGLAPDGGKASSGGVHSKRTLGALGAALALLTSGCNAGSQSPPTFESLDQPPPSPKWRGGIRRRAQRQLDRALALARERNDPIQVWRAQLLLGGALTDRRSSSTAGRCSRSGVTACSERRAVGCSAAISACQTFRGRWSG